MFSLILAFGLCGALPDVESAVCVLPAAPTVGLPAEQAQVLASTSTSDASPRALRRIDGRRQKRVVDRLKRRVARHERA